MACMENPEIAFWRAVIARAWADAVSPQDSRERAEARRWLTGFSSDFRIVCHLADIDPEHLCERAKDMERNDWPQPKRAA